MRALITGAAGFVGRHLATHLLETGDEVLLTGRSSDLTSLVREFSNEKYPKARIATVDIRNVQEIRDSLAAHKIDVVYHLAAVTFIPEVERDRPAAFDANVGGTLRVFEAARSQSPAPKILFVSTGHLYAPSKSPIPESGALDAGSFYSITKRQGEEIAQYFGAREVPSVIARPFNHSGPGQNAQFVLPSFARQVAEAEAGKREPCLAVGNLDAVRDFLDVRDVVRAYRALAVAGGRGEVYNVASGVGRSIRSALDRLLAKSRVPIGVNVETSRLRANDVHSIIGDASKVKALTGWAPRIPFEKMLDDLLEEARIAVAAVRPGQPVP